MEPALPIYVAAGILAAALVCVLAQRRLARMLAKARWRRRSRRARRGERVAEGLLQGLGYTVENRQVPAVWTIRVDNQARDIEVRADLVVTRNGVRYVAEVKTGAAAPRISTVATRRQLLEYHMAYDVDGVLLVDVEANRVRRVEFPPPRQRPGGWRLAWLGVFAAGAATGVIAARLLPL